MSGVLGPNVIGKALRQILVSITPTWLVNNPQARNLFSFLYEVAVLGDALREIAWEGQLAAYPGVGTPDAFPYIAQSRGLTQGANEPNAAFALRCIFYRAAWKKSGAAIGLALELQPLLFNQGSISGFPIIRIVDRAGHAVTLDASQNITFANISWSWDNLGGWVETQVYSPQTVAGWWSDIWILIQDPYTHYTSFADAAWLAAWNTNDQAVDSRVLQSVVQSVFGVVSNFKGGHNYVRAIIWTASPTTFTPTGYYGNNSRNIAGTQTQTRTQVDAYWQPVGGD